jgi:hypothetical protein
MELPGILRRIVTADSQGFIALCPNEYDMDNISEMIAEVLAECEALVGGNTPDPVPSGTSQKS